MTDHLRILALDYRIQHSTESEREAGDIEHETGVIHVKGNVQEQYVILTVIHEALHSICHQCGLDEIDADERAINCLALGLVCMLRDNPEVAKWLSANSR